jgi:2-aminoethylphosphonate-pyruvate transaminase
MNIITSNKDKVLFTPGPLTTSCTVKQAMLTDLGSRDVAFIEIVRQIRQKLLEIGACSPNRYTAIPMQGSGTFGIEAVVSSTIPSDGKLLVIANGAYGERIAKIADVLNISCHVLRGPEDKTLDLDRVKKVLEANLGFTHVAVVHCETTTGIINPIQEIGEISNDFDCKFFVDAMSSFGAVTMNFHDCYIDYLVSSANKCIEGVPGFSFVVARTRYLRTNSRNMPEA